jgi:hypothetical protein
MNMNRTVMMISRAAAIAAVLLLTAGLRASAQGPAPSNERFDFGPPLRPNIVFIYKYTERVTEIHQIDGQVVDSNQRLLNYYISQRQVPSPTKKGAIDIEANIDSMNIDVRAMDGSKIYFNTQELTGAPGEQELIRHREVFGPSTLVNRMATFTLTPYGEILKVKSPSLEQARKDVQDPHIDDFTRARILEVMTDEYLASVYLPWRNVEPLSRKIAYNKDVAIPFLTAFDRISFRDSAIVRVVHGADGAPHLTFTSNLDRPISKSMTIAAFDEPVRLESASASVNGDLTLDEDGVVLSGWTTMKGSAVGKREGIAVRSSITHEVYVQQVAMAPVTSN